jgi:photosystem II stability/assembly factor-like uncharacterized protein
MMVRLIASMVLALLVFNLPVAAAVEPRPAIKAPLATMVVFLDIAYAGERVVATGERGVVVYSDDAGGTWTQADVPTRSTLTAAAFVDEKTGFAVGHDAVILKTTDGGASWQLLNFEPESRNVMLNVRFRDARRGYVVGTDGQLWVTQDGGVTWDRRTLAVEDWYQNHIFDIAWLHVGTTLAVAEKGVLYRSSDGLQEFAPIESPYDGSYFGALSPDGAGFLIYGMNGHVFVSVDAGSSWQEVATNTDQFLLDATILRDGRVLLVGAGGAVLTVEPGSGRVLSAPRPDGVGINAVLVGDDSAYLALATGGIRKLPLTELLPR